ncbi:MAG: SurA N-terminal domain-containing protein [Myxococcales bacterium]|nr:SurA N-terminal domain-containing protein [Myxococcales bacterium]
MEAFRSQSVKSVVYGALIVVCVVVFVFGFGSGMGGRASGKSMSLREECVVVVRGHCVTPRDYNGARRMFLRRMGGDPSQAQSMGINRVVVDGLIERELLISDASRLGLTVTEPELNDQLVAGIVRLSLPSDKESMAYSLRIEQGRFLENFRDPKTKQFDMKTYERAVKLFAGRSPADFRESQSRELLAAKMRDLIRAPVRVSEVEALEGYIAEKSSASLTYVNVSQKFAAKHAVSFTDAEVEKWAAEEANKKLIEAAVTSHKDGSVPKEKQIRHILVKVDPSATIEAKSLALGRLSEAAARIKRGEPFGEVAREMSEDPGSAPKGGAYGDEMLDKFVEPFKVAAKALKPGETTPGAVETQFGFHLIMRDDPSKAAEVEAALPKFVARDMFQKSKSLEAAKSLGDKIYAAMKAGKSAEDSVKDTLATIKATPAPFAPLPVMPPPSGAAAGADAGSAAMGDAGAAVASVAPPYAAKVVTLENDPERPTVQSSSSFNRGGDPIPVLTGEAAVNVLSFAFSGKPGELYKELLRGEDGFVAVMLKERKAATKEEFEKERETYMQTLLASKQNEALSLYLRRLRETAKAEVKTNESYLKEPSRDAGAAPLSEEE